MHRPIQTVRNIFYLILGVIGLPVNLVAILILSKRKYGVSPCTTRYLVAMATTDLLFIILEIIMYRYNEYFFPRNFLDITPVCAVRYALRRAVTDCSVWFTVTFTFDRFIVICCSKLRSKYCNEKTAVVVLATSGILLSLKNIPIYFRFQPFEIINKIPWVCVNTRTYYYDPVWTAFKLFEKILTPILPFVLILLLNTLIIRHIVLASRVRKVLMGQKQRQDHSDTEMESRRKDMILLFTISGSFIILWLWYLLDYSAILNHILDVNNEHMFEKIAYMLRDLGSCTNTIIYVVTLSKFRKEIRNTVKELFHKLFNETCNKIHWVQ